jgi:prolyl-tRNA synthetase
MRQSKLFTKTIKDVPKDEVSLNSTLLIKAGFITKEISGAYSFLPLGNRVLQKIINIIREEMNLIGGQEILLTALQSPRVWEASDRWADSRMDVWFKTKLKNKKELGLAPTHEEPITNLMKSYIKSYKDLPVYAYQFQTKFRNETRAKSGILRTREFIMKDLYSFCESEEDLNRYYETVKQAYVKIFNSLGIGKKTYITFASGSSFSKYSHEFQTICEFGEDTIYICDETGIAINAEIFNPKVINELGLSGKNFTKLKAIEVGNIFKLGTKFSDSLNLTFTDKQGKSSPVVMGSYGIGPARVMGTIVESSYDENGIIWPTNVAPYQIHLLLLGKETELKIQTEELYKNLQSHGYDVLYDDRQNVSPGSKLKDADLIGCPLQIILSAKNQKDNKIELKVRATGKTHYCKVNHVIEEIRSIIG